MKAINSFITGYIWPQWPRLIAAVVSALVCSALLSLNFLTLIPLLKVMVEGEGIHGWLDRKISAVRYGMDLRMPEPGQLASGGPYAGGLVVAAVRPDTAAAEAGLEAQDLIVGVEAPDRIEGPAQVLSYLASSNASQIRLLVGTVKDPNLVRPLVLPGPLAAPSELGPDRRWYADLQRDTWLWVLAGARRLSGLIPEGPSHTTEAVVRILAAIFLISLVRCTAKYYQNYIAAKIVHVAVMRMKQDVFAHMTRVPIGVLDTQRPSDCVSRVVRDTNEIAMALHVMLGPALREPLNTASFIAAAFLLNWQLTAVFLCGGPFVIVLASKFGRRMRRASHRSLQAASQMLGTLHQMLAALKLVKVYNRYDYETDRFAAITRAHLHEQLKMAKIEAGASPAMEVIGMAAACLALGLGVHWIARTGSSEFLTLLVLLGASADAARKSSDLWPKLQRSVAPAQRLTALLNQPREDQTQGATVLKDVAGRIEFLNVTFTYPGATSPALQGIDLVIEPGQTVAIVGANGSGKTTLVNLIPRFYDPDQGQILIDGVPIAQVTLESLRAHIGLVTQNLISFHDTIANNIAYGKPGATEAEIVEAARQAHADGFIQQLPQGYQTVIGEGGTGLSGGQLQRIAIARAILKDPAILILDEATSQIDSESEIKIHQAIEQISGRRTTIIIAHRFSTVQAADKVVVLQDGRIADQGNHLQLVQSCQVYKALYQTQLVH